MHLHPTTWPGRSLPILLLAIGWWLCCWCPYPSAGMTVTMSPTNQKVFDNSNITLVCIASANEHTGNLSLSARARMFLVLLTIPRGGQAHQVQGVLHCDARRTRCESEFNLAVDCISDRINISKPMDTLETACQLNDEAICSNEWLGKHRDDCVTLGKLTVIKGPKLGEKCIHRNASALDTLLPCGQHQVCSPAYGVCQCQPKYRPEKRKCVAEEPDLEASGGAQPLITHSSHSHHSPRPTPSPPPPPPPTHNGGPNGGGVQVLPTMTDDEGANKPAPPKTAGGSKALVIFLMIVAILLCIALAVVIIWSRNRSRDISAVAS